MSDFAHTPEEVRQMIREIEEGRRPLSTANLAELAQAEGAPA